MCNTHRHCIYNFIKAWAIITRVNLEIQNFLFFEWYKEIGYYYYTVVYRNQGQYGWLIVPILRSGRKYQEKKKYKHNGSYCVCGVCINDGSVYLYS